MRRSQGEEAGGVILAGCQKLLKKPFRSAIVAGRTFLE